MNIKICIQDLKDNNYAKSSILQIEDNKMCYSIHDFGESTPNGDEIEIWHNFDEENTLKFLEVLGLTDKNENQVKKELQEKFSQRPKQDVFNSIPSIDFNHFIKEHGITYKFSSW